MAELVCRQCGEIVAPFPDGVCPEHGRLAAADICEELEFEFTCRRCRQFVDVIGDDGLCADCLNIEIDGLEGSW